MLDFKSIIEKKKCYIEYPKTFENYDSPHHNKEVLKDIVFIMMDNDCNPEDVKYVFDNNVALLTYIFKELGFDYTKSFCRKYPIIYTVLVSDMIEELILLCGSRMSNSDDGIYDFLSSLIIIDDEVFVQKNKQLTAPIMLCNNEKFIKELQEKIELPKIKFNDLNSFTKDVLSDYLSDLVDIKDFVLNLIDFNDKNIIDVLSFTLVNSEKYNEDNLIKILHSMSEGNINYFWVRFLEYSGFVFINAYKKFAVKPKDNNKE